MATVIIRPPTPENKRGHLWWLAWIGALLIGGACWYGLYRLAWWAFCNAHVTCN